MQAGDVRETCPGARVASGSQCPGKLESSDRSLCSADGQRHF